MNWKTSRPDSHPQGLRRGHGVCGCGRGLRAGADTTPFKWNGGNQLSVIGLHSIRPDKYTVIASYTPAADRVFCDYDPIRKKASIGSSFLERE